MIVPYRPIYLPKAYKRFRYIIIHDFSCQFSAIDKARADNKLPNIQGVRVYNWMFKNEFELPYHFVCEKIDQDYETIMARPLSYLCEYKDIPDQYINSVHIAVGGNFNIIGPTQRTYQQIAYRSIASIVRWFAIPLSNVLFHSEVTMSKEEKDLHCPGKFFRKERFESVMREYILMKKG